MSRSFVRAGIGAVLLVVISAGTALGHECYNTQRSAQGNAGAAKSAAWDQLTLADLFGSAHTFLPIEPMDAGQVAQAVAMAEAAGVPSSVVILGSTTIGANSAAYQSKGKATDGQGVDWFFTKYGQTLVGIAFAVGTPLGG